MTMDMEDELIAYFNPLLNRKYLDTSTLREAIWDNLNGFQIMVFVLE